jgi:hypothetical protein
MNHRNRSPGIRKHLVMESCHKHRSILPLSTGIQENLKVKSPMAILAAWNVIIILRQRPPQSRPDRGSVFLFLCKLVKNQGKMQTGRLFVRSRVKSASNLTHFASYFESAFRLGKSPAWTRSFSTPFPGIERGIRPSGMENECLDYFCYSMHHHYSID